MYRVIVDNIGTVYDGDDIVEAVNTYQEYVKQVRDQSSRAGDSVVLMREGRYGPEIEAEYERPGSGNSEGEED